MDKKTKNQGFINLGTVLAVIIILAVAIIYFWQNFAPMNNTDESGDTNNAQLANPAAVHCEEQGGQTETRIIKVGEKGFCKFDDGSECGQWEFFRDECSKGQRFCKDLCGDGKCQEIVCQALGCPCPETTESCSEDCE